MEFSCGSVQHTFLMTSTYMLVLDISYILVYENNYFLS